MARVTSRLADPAYALLRVVTGLLFAQHGLQKIFGLLGGSRVPLMSQLGLAGVIELVAGVMVALGILPRWAALIAAGEMSVAYFTRHAPQGLWPVVNRGELAVLYCFVFLYIAARGGGPWSVTRG
jgi:putative oxidoreductase